MGTDGRRIPMSTSVLSVWPVCWLAVWLQVEANHRVLSVGKFKNGRSHLAHILTLQSVWIGYGVHHIAVTSNVSQGPRRINLLLSRDILKWLITVHFTVHVEQLQWHYI